MYMYVCICMYVLHICKSFIKRVIDTSIASNMTMFLFTNVFIAFEVVVVVSVMYVCICICIRVYICIYVGRL